MYNFVREITILKSNCRGNYLFLYVYMILDPVTAACKAKSLCDVVDFLTSIINPVKAAREWKFENVASLFTTMHE